jgi:hypothetical protein
MDPLTAAAGWLGVALPLVILLGAVGVMFRALRVGQVLLTIVMIAAVAHLVPVLAADRDGPGRPFALVLIVAIGVKLLQLLARMFLGRQAGDDLTVTAIMELLRAPFRLVGSALRALTRL